MIPIDLQRDFRLTDFLFFQSTQDNSDYHRLIADIKVYVNTPSESTENEENLIEPITHRSFQEKKRNKREKMNITVTSVPKWITLLTIVTKSLSQRNTKAQRMNPSQKYSFILQQLTTKGWMDYRRKLSSTLGQPTLLLQQRNVCTTDKTAYRHAAMPIWKASYYWNRCSQNWNDKDNFTHWQCSVWARLKSQSRFSHQARGKGSRVGIWQKQQNTEERLNCHCLSRGIITFDDAQNGSCMVRIHTKC